MKISSLTENSKESYFQRACRLADSLDNRHIKFVKIYNQKRIEMKNLSFEEYVERPNYWNAQLEELGELKISVERTLILFSRSVDLMEHFSGYGTLSSKQHLN